MITPLPPDPRYERAYWRNAHRILRQQQHPIRTFLQFLLCGR